jgi:G:T-mismatch repair DNA endonuclease (very short patch repair protein)
MYDCVLSETLSNISAEDDRILIGVNRYPRTYEGPTAHSNKDFYLINMSNNFRLNRKCPICGFKVSDKNKSGFCNKHRDRTGINNPFYGKTHDRTMIENTKKKLRKISKALWKDNNYRNKVIKAVSKPRRKRFKKEQSIRITQWYKDNPKQLKIRSKAMKNTWAEGRIKPNENMVIYNKSKIEKRLLKDIRLFCKEAIGNYVINTKKHRWYYPDVIIKSKRVIIELYGDYWHANSKKYYANDIVHHNILAKDIWKRDRIRIRRLTKLGYKVIIIWESEYKKNKNKVLSRIENELLQTNNN